MNKNKKNEAVKPFDLSDTPDPRGRRGPPPTPTRPPTKSGPTSPPRGGERKKLPGVRQEATPFDSSGGTASGPTRSRTQTQQLTPPQMGQDQSSPTGKWDVDLPNGMRIRIPATSADVARKTAGEWMRRQPSAGEGRPQQVDYSRLNVSPVTAEASTGGDVAGFSAPGDDFKEAVREMVREIVRKKAGGGGYNLYPPNKGKKKKNQKSVGSFATRLQAKEAELQRFPPKDPEQLKRARERLAKLRKDPKKRIEKEKGDLSGSKKPKKESVAQDIARRLAERLFREDEIPGSPWDERLDSLHPDALASDKKLDALHREMQAASVGALGDGHKSMAKALRGIAKVHPGEHAFDSNRKKMYLPVHLEVDGTEVGPVHLYVDGGHVKIELSNDARQQIAALEPSSAKDVRGGLMAVEEDHLPKIDRAKRAWDERDRYLDKVHAGLEKRIGGMSGVEAHLAKGLLAKHGKGKK